MLKGFFIVLMSLSLSVTAAVYKWTDAQGNVHYGDKPVDSNQANEIKVDSATVRSGVTESRAEKRGKLLDAMAEDRLEKKEKREKQKAERKQRRAKCNYLKDRLRRLVNSSRAYRLDKDGKRVYVSNQSREKSIGQLRKQVRKTCR